MDKIGKLIEGNEERDAIHIAIAPVIAGHDLLPGQHVGFIKNDGETVGVLAGTKLGIVDPFLSSAEGRSATIKRGTKFWLFLYPNTITSLKHNWTHPAFEETEAKKISREWMAKWAVKYGWSVDMAMAAGDDREFFLGDVCYDEIPPEFWFHYGIIRNGQPMRMDEKYYFRCAC